MSPLCHPGSILPLGDTQDPQQGKKQVLKIDVWIDGRLDGRVACKIAALTLQVQQTAVSKEEKTTNSKALEVNSDISSSLFNLRRL